MRIAFVILLFFPFTVFSQAEESTIDTLRLNQSSNINCTYLTSEGILSVLEPKNTIYLTQSLIKELEEFLGLNYLKEFDFGVIRTTPDLFMILEFRKIQKITKVKKKDKGSFTESTGGAEYVHWTITIDLNEKKVISKNKREYYIKAKF